MSLSLLPVSKMAVEMTERLPFSVDTWTECSSSKKKYHFLTHAHKDHTGGMAAHASYPVYCTSLTKQIVRHRYPTLDEGIFVELEIGESLLIDAPDEPFTVTAFDANHCPGAIMLLFEGDFGNVLHTGDCRLSTDCLSKLPRKFTVRRTNTCRDCLDCLYLDCTFGRESFKMPSKYSAIRQVLDCIWKHPSASTVYLACDILGQEEILMEISKTFGSKIYVDKSSLSDYHAILSIVAPELLSEDPSCRFHVSEGFPRLYEKAKAKFDEAKRNNKPEPLFIRPSAQWYTCEEREGVGSGFISLTVLPRRHKQSAPKEAERDQFGVWHVCYSMHSSQEELEEALAVLNPKEVISTTPSCRATELRYVRDKISSAGMHSENDLGFQFRARKAGSRAGSASGISCDMVIQSTMSRSAEKMCHPTKQQEQSADVCILLEEQHSETNLQFSTPNKPVPLFGRARHSLPPSPPMSFSDEEDTSRSPECNISLNNVDPEPLDDIKPLIPGGKNPYQFTGLSGATVFQDECISYSASRKESEDGSQHSVRRVLHMEEEFKNTSPLIDQSRKSKCQAENTSSPNTMKDGEDKNSKVGYIQSFQVEESSLSFGNSIPRTLHQSVRNMYRSLHVPVPKALPSLMDLAYLTKRPKLRSSQN